MLGCVLCYTLLPVGRKLLKRYSCKSVQRQLKNCYNTSCLIDILRSAYCAHVHKKISNTFSHDSKKII